MMAVIRVTLPDGAVKEYVQGTTVEQVAASISSSLNKSAVAGKVDEMLVDLSFPLEKDAALAILTLDSPDGLQVYRHSTAHLMAQAVKRIYGQRAVKLGIGPVIEDGFYYDLDLDISLTPEDLVNIEQEMERITEENLAIRRRVVSREDALRMFSELEDPYKLELIRAMPEDAVITIYDQGEFFDLCRGPHLPSTGRIKAFKLQAVRGYREVRTPFIYNQRLWEQSGHWDHYHENMYFTNVDDTPFALKPMNCPGHMLIYKNELRSYRELPIRISEFGQVHRHEFSGALNGMLRVRTFCQDDAHLFVRPDQIEEEIGCVIELIDTVYRVFGFEYRMELSTRPVSSMGSDQMWNEAETALRNVLEARGVHYRINEGDGTFYGPKIDFHILDALKRSWQCATIQLDFQMPEKFDLHYVDENNSKLRPIVIHRALYGSIDRFIGILTEHFAGNFPIWLSPVQAKVLPVSPAFEAYAREAALQLQRAGIRVEADLRGEKLGYKIREAQLEKVPYMLVCGEIEAQSGTLSVRKRGQGDFGAQCVEAVVQMIEADIANKTA